MKDKKHGSMKVSAALLLLGLLAGCGSSGGGGKSSSSSSSKSTSASSASSTKSTKDTGKTYTPDTKSAPPAGGNTTLPTPADTTDNLPSPASDAGSANAIKGQAVMNPGAPPAPQTPVKPH